MCSKLWDTMNGGLLALLLACPKSSVMCVTLCSVESLRRCPQGGGDAPSSSMGA